MLITARCLVRRLRLGLDLVSGWLAIMHRYIHAAFRCNCVPPTYTVVGKRKLQYWPHQSRSRAVDIPCPTSDPSATLDRRCSGITFYDNMCDITNNWQNHSVNSSSSSVNGDIAIQWECSNFDPSQNPNPLTDYNKTLHNWLRPREEHNIIIDIIIIIEYHCILYLFPSLVNWYLPWTSASATTVLPSGEWENVLPKWRCIFIRQGAARSENSGNMLRPY